MNSRLHRACDRLAEFLVRHPILVLTGIAVSVVFSLAIAAQLRFDFTPQAIYRGDDDLVAYSETFKQTFGYDEAVILVVLEATGELDALNAGALQWQAEIAGDFKAVPYVKRVESLATLEIPRPTLGGIELRHVIDELPVDEDSALRARGLLSTQLLVRGRMLSSDERVAALPLFLDPNARDIASMQEAVAAIRTALQARKLPPGYRTHLSGLPVLRVEIVESLHADLQRLMPMAGLVYLVVLGLMFRCVSGVIPPLAAVGIGVAWTLATFAATNQSLNIVSNVLPVLLVIIGVSSAIQIVSTFAEESVCGTVDLKLAARETIARMAPACLLAAITTAVGFASLCTARSVLLHGFGWQAAIGISFQYLATLITLGTCFSFCAPPRLSSSIGRSSSPLARALGAAGVAVAHHSWWTIAGAAIVVVGAVWVGSSVRINSVAILETFPTEHPSVKSMRLIENKLSGIMPLEVSLDADSSDVFLRPATFHRVLDLEQAARKLSGVLAVDSYADLFREVLIHWPGRRLSETDEELVPAGRAGEVRLERTSRFIQGFAEVFHYKSYVSSDGKRVRIRMRLREIGSHQTLGLIDSLEAELARVFPPEAGIRARLTGEAYVNARALNRLIRDLYYSLLTASLVIFGLIAIEFRSIRAGLIAMLPNLTPLTITLGYMGLRGYDLNVGNVIVFTICLGLADDSTIHFLYRFREELRDVGDVTEAIYRAFFSTGRAIVATSLVLLAGMGVLLLSNFVPTQRFAELTGVTILGNLLGVLLLLPASLVLFWKKVPNPQDSSTAKVQGT